MILRSSIFHRSYVCKQSVFSLLCSFEIHYPCWCFTIQKYMIPEVAFKPRYSRMTLARVCLILSSLLSLLSLCVAPCTLLSALFLCPHLFLSAHTHLLISGHFLIHPLNYSLYYNYHNFFVLLTFQILIPHYKFTHHDYRHH